MIQDVKRFLSILVFYVQIQKVTFLFGYQFHLIIHHVLHHCQSIDDILDNQNLHETIDHEIYTIKIHFLVRLHILPLKSHVCPED
ncbi:unnamed protein product [Schistosoma mattheei]|uniref:Uncharacterized protein n=1 Tax=Schistosoma mattheei TaxID=31246 RepID=A0A183NYP2_9TREM|nr:unnamed protein product [Schistosoma mattheei]